MKQADVKVGETYLTYIGTNLCKVVVMREEQNSDNRTVYRVRRVQENCLLPKPRTAAALRPV